MTAPKKTREIETRWRALAAMKPGQPGYDDLRSECDAAAAADVAHLVARVRSLELALRVAHVYLPPGSIAEAKADLALADEVTP